MIRYYEFLAIAAVFTVLASAQEEHLSIRKAEVNCKIPNEAKYGVCVKPQNCPAFRNITAGQQLGETGRLSFVLALECLSVNEALICCPTSGSYEKPELSLNVVKRKRNAPFGIVTRFGVIENIGQPALTIRAQKFMAELDEFPWAALLFYHDHHLCGGVLISSMFVLTAAHCLTGKRYDQFGPLKFVRLGEYHTQRDPDSIIINGYYMVNEKVVDIRPQSIKVHPDYVSDSVHQYHDIGLIKLDQEVRYSFTIKPICLPMPRFATGLEIGRTFRVCGWGGNNFFGPLHQSPLKMKIKPSYIENHICEDNYRAEKLSLGPGQFCAGGKNGQDACSGDSGSPLMFYDRLKSAWVLSGIVSRGSIICGEDNKPGIYTNVKYYLPWIKENVQL